jgi:DNA-binding transcriptional LysR family regulator
MPDLRQLRTFVAVAEELNFTRAAERLHLGQQAVSKSIGQLERELGVVLLERTSHEVRLTAAGRELLAGGPGALAAVDEAFERARRVGRGVDGTIRVGITPALGGTEREEVVRALRDDAPDVSVLLLEVWPDGAAAALRRRDVELVVTRTAPADPELGRAALEPTRARLYVAADHRLAGRPEAVEISALDGERLLTWNEPGTPLTDLLVDSLAAHGARVRAVRTRVSGMAASPFSDLVPLGAVALGPPAWSAAEGVVELDLAGEILLPLTVLWAAGAAGVAVDRVRRRLGPGARGAETAA